MGWALPTAQALPRTWDGAAGDLDWFNPGNWDGHVATPATGDAVTIPGGSTVTLTNQTPLLTSFTITNATLTFKDTTNAQVAELRATDVFIQNLGKLNHVPQSMTNAVNGVWLVDGRVYLTCTTLTVDNGGAINVNGKGYSSPANEASLGFGPGAGKYRDGNGCSGAGHGGVGGDGGGNGASPKWDPMTMGTNYDDATAPVYPGSGACNSTNNCGGGVIRINASGAVTVNGTISADGVFASANHSAGAGSGGSVYITCATLAGSGMISANGGDSSRRNYTGGGGGGRIAVYYTDTANQSADVTVQFWAAGGDGAAVGPPYIPSKGAVGTLYLSGSKFFPRTTMVGSYNLIIPGFTNWSPASLTVTNQASTKNTAVQFPDGIQIAVGGNLTIASTNAILDLRNGAQLSVGGNMILTNGGQFKGYAGPTNGAAPAQNGLLVSVGGTLTMATNCYIYPYSDPTNGGSVKFAVGSLDLQAGAVIDGDGKGFGIPPFNAIASGNGRGPGKGLGGNGNYGGGGGYGGKGGDAGVYTGGQPYGSSNAPIDAGSSGGCAIFAAGKGGGVVWIEASRTVRVDGTILAHGYSGYAHSGGGGAGGSIYLTANRFEGAGVLSAIGGNGTGGGLGSGGGGGGRIAVWRQKTTWTGFPLTAADTLAVTNGVSVLGATTGTVGTIVWKWIPTSGTLFVVH